MFGIMRVRSVLSYAVHSYWRGFVYVNTPISQDLMQKVLVKCLKLQLYHLTERQTEDGKVRIIKKISLERDKSYGFGTTGENFYDGFGSDLYFGPTFRRNSDTSRHLAEFWMIEKWLQ
jgi:aspartyl/asparaginyl-tRNA synthetase